MYEVGDFVVYRLLTVCKIEGIETPSFESTKRDYYRLSPYFDNRSNTVIYVPVDGADALRPLTTAARANALLREFPQIKPSVCTVKKPPQVNAYYQEILSSVDLRRYVALLKEVAAKEKATPKKLSEIDLKYRNKTERLLCEEFALALGEAPESIRNRIAQ